VDEMAMATFLILDRPAVVHQELEQVAHLHENSLLGNGPMFSCYGSFPEAVCSPS
jgi:hypothetical protein